MIRKGSSAGDSDQIAYEEFVRLMMADGGTGGSGARTPAPAPPPPAPAPAPAPVPAPVVPAAAPVADSGFFDIIMLQGASGRWPVSVAPRLGRAISTAAAAAGATPPGARGTTSGTVRVGDLSAATCAALLATPPAGVPGDVWVTCVALAALEAWCGRDRARWALAANKATQWLKTHQPSSPTGSGAGAGVGASRSGGVRSRVAISASESVPTPGAGCGLAIGLADGLEVLGSSSSSNQPACAVGSLAALRAAACTQRRSASAC